MEIKTYNFIIKGDERGSLIALEGERDLPFPIKRVYYIFNPDPNLRRGLHAHRTLQQVMICLRGSCHILLDNGSERESLLLDRSSRGLLIDRMIWHEMYGFSEDCLLLVLAGDIYDEGDYIRDYTEFLVLVKKETCS